jgi:hypothetical protein
LSVAERARLLTGSDRNSRAKVVRNVKAGTRFIREWQGRTIEVTTAEDGRFVYRGQSYASLSAIARQITGTRWSGPAFFGIGPGREIRNGS